MLNMTIVCAIPTYIWKLQANTAIKLTKQLIPRLVVLTRVISVCATSYAFRCARYASVRLDRDCRMVGRVQSPSKPNYSQCVCETVKRMKEKWRRKYGRREMKRYRRDIPAQKDAASLWSKLPGMQGEGTACVAVAQEVESNLLSWIRLWILCRGVWAVAAAVRLVAFSIPRLCIPLSSNTVGPRPSLSPLHRRPYNYSSIFRDRLANSLPDRTTHFDPARSGY